MSVAAQCVSCAMGSFPVYEYDGGLTYQSTRRVLLKEARAAAACGVALPLSTRHLEWNYGVPVRIHEVYRYHWRDDGETGGHWRRFTNWISPCGSIPRYRNSVGTQVRTLGCTYRSNFQTDLTSIKITQQNEKVLDESPADSAISEIACRRGVASPLYRLWVGRVTPSDYVPSDPWRREVSTG